MQTSITGLFCFHIFYCDTSLSYFFWFAFPRTIDSFKQAHFLLSEQRGENGWVERKKGRFWKFETSWDKQTAVTLNELSKIICDYIVLSTFSFLTCPLFPPSLRFLPQPAIFLLHFHWMTQDNPQRTGDLPLLFGVLPWVVYEQKKNVRTNWLL